MNISQRALNGLSAKYSLRLDLISEGSWGEMQALIYKDITGKLYLQAKVNWNQNRDFLRVSCELHGSRRIGSIQERSFASLTDAFVGIIRMFNQLSLHYRDQIQHAVLSEPAYIGLSAVKATLKVCNQKSEAVGDPDKSLAILASMRSGDANPIPGAWYRHLEDRWMMHFVHNMLKS